VKPAGFQQRPHEARSPRRQMKSQRQDHENKTEPSRVCVTNPGEAQTSTVAHLYVMSPGVLTDRVVLDNFDDDRPTGWSLPLGGQLRETNQQLTVGGYWPGVMTHNPPDTAAGAALYRNWSVGNCQTLEWRADVVGMPIFFPCARKEDAIPRH
jgi:hypothetical protein